MSRLPAQLMTDWKAARSLSPIAKRRRRTPLSCARAPAHVRFQLFLSPLKTSQHFFFYLLPVPPSVHLSPSQWRRLPRLIARSPKPALRGSCCNEQETPDRPGGSELGEVRLKRFGPLGWITPTSHVTLAVFLCSFFVRKGACSWVEGGHVIAVSGEELL